MKNFRIISRICGALSCTAVAIAVFTASSATAQQQNRDAEARVDAYEPRAEDEGWAEPEIRREAESDASEEEGGFAEHPEPDASPRHEYYLGEDYEWKEPGSHSAEEDNGEWYDPSDWFDVDHVDRQSDSEAYTETASDTDAEEKVQPQRQGRDYEANHDEEEGESKGDRYVGNSYYTSDWFESKADFDRWYDE